MARRHRITIQPASDDEIANVAEWYRQAGVTSLGLAGDGDVSELNEAFLQARRDGILGSAVGGGVEGVARIAGYSDPLDMAFARTLVASMRFDTDTIGMLVMGPPVALLNRFFGQLPQEIVRDESQMQDLYWKVFIGLTKLHMVAIRPDFRGRGCGSRFVRHAIDVARKSKMMRMFGEFKPDRTHLASFYTQLGFSVMKEDQLLDLSFLTGHEFMTYPVQGDVMFTRDV